MSFNSMVDKLCQNKEFIDAFKGYMKQDSLKNIESQSKIDKRTKGANLKKGMEENLRNVSDVEEKSREVVSPAFASAVREIKTNDKFRDRANKRLNAPKESKEDLPNNLTFNKSLFKEGKESNIIRFIKGEFTKNELEQLRQDIVLNSIYTSEYENRFNINPKFIQDFFDGYIDFIDQDFDKDDINTLQDWYYTVDYSDYIDNPSQLEADYYINLNEDLEDDIEEITVGKEKGSIEVGDEDDKYEVIRNLKRKGYHIETSYNDLSHKYHIEYWK